METKTVNTTHEVKDADKGIVSIQFAKYDTIDGHGDVHRKGAFTDGAPLLVSAYGHSSWQGAMPVGKGVIKDSGSGPTAELQFFMDTTAGRDTFNTIKATGDLQQWSYGYDTKEASYGTFGDDEKDVRFLLKQQVYEVSPVLVGAAGNDSRTLDLKGEGGRMKMHDQSLEVLTSAKRLVDRAEEIVTLREQSGKKGLGEESEALLGLIEMQLKRFRDLITKPAPTIEPDDDLTSIYLWSVVDLTEE